MPDRYFDKSTKTELFENPLVPAQLQYNAMNSDHAALPDTNPFFSELPAGQQVTYDIDGLPDGLEPIPAPVYSAFNQARIDLFNAGVTPRTVANARYLDGRGDSSELAAIDASIDAIVISSSLTLSQVVALIGT